MGMNYGPWIEYHCFNDCEQAGCPGHKVRQAYHRTSDVLFFEFESSKETQYFDLNRWRAMKMAELAAELE